jgi:hypothetical protein
MAISISKASNQAARKIIALKERKTSGSALTMVDDQGALHIVMQPQKPAPDPIDVKLNYCFQGIRDNFKKYNTKAKYHINSRFIAPHAEQKIINDCFNKDEDLKRLMKYLNISLNEFAANLKRFLKSVQNTDYQPVISTANYNSPNLTIEVRNAKGKQIGPFLRTGLYQDNHDGYTRMDVSIGYVSKKRKKVVTHSFSYDINCKADEYTERHGNEEVLKNEAQIVHDKFSNINVKELKRNLKIKHNR